MPKLGEGTLVVNVIRLAGVDVDEAAASNTRLEQLILEEFPDEVARAWSRLGTAEVATDPMGIELTDIFLALRAHGGSGSGRARSRNWPPRSSDTCVTSRVSTWC